MEPEIKAEENQMEDQISQDLQIKLQLNGPEEKPQIEADAVGNHHILQNLISPLHHSIDWLGRLAHLSKIPYHQILNWSQELLGYLNGNRALIEQPLNNLTLQSFTKDKQTYLCFSQSFHDNYTLLKIRSIQGNLMMFRVVENDRKIDEIANILNKISQKIILVMLDEQGDEEFFTKLRDIINVVNLIYIYQGTVVKTQQKNNDFLTKSYGDRTAIFNQKSNKKLSYTIQQFIKAIIIYQQQDYNKLLTCFGQNHNQICYDRAFLIAYLLKNQLYPDRDNVIYLKDILENGISYLKDSLEKKEQNKMKHFPNRSQNAQKHYCVQCNRKCDIFCQGCKNINQREIYLCVGKCFCNYHKLQISLTQNGTKTEINKNILFFDDKCTVIKETVNEIQQLQNRLDQYKTANAIQAQVNDFDSNDQQMTNQKSGLVRQYYDYLNYKMIQYFNLIAQRRLYENKDDSESAN